VKIPEQCRTPEGAEPRDDGYGLIAERRERAFSNKSLRPTAASAITIRKVMGEQFGYIPDLTLDALTKELADQCTAVAKGNMERPEAMLMSQAQTLDAIFQHLVQQGYSNLRNIDDAERWLRLAFRAQGQCRAAIETLGYLKNPTAVFTKQANLTTGPQQINNGDSRVRETESVQNEVLELKNGERLESRTSVGAGRGDSEMATVAKLNRAKDR
jgi:ribosomal protein S8